MTASQPEFSRMIDRRQITAEPAELSASEAERAALARRFGLVSIGRLDAVLDLIAEGAEVSAKGRLDAAFVQSCAVSGEDLPGTIREQISLRFVPERRIEAEEVELNEDELDEIAYSGTAFDLGEAVAQSFALAFDPYATGPDADSARKEAGITDSTGPSGPLADALASLRQKK